MAARKPSTVAPTSAVGDDVLSLDIDSLTLDEIDDIEEIIDGPLDSLSKPGARKAKLLKAMAYVIKKRDNPDFTIADAGRLKISLKASKANPPVTSA
ncbi:hypothetical protein ACIBKZ_15580 [Streptomyces sp. NPDC050421]|uniref:hypothetical protein n=1 Tax=Streptomyces sp. NPDC050421 TaxID=3365613 RepID=UPI0037BD63C8